MKLVRPYIPVRVRCEVIARQLLHDGRTEDLLRAAIMSKQAGTHATLAYLLKCKFGDEKFQLDHEPALCLREIIDAERGIYKPDANDPEYLIYRTAEEHKTKTFLRGDGAQLSDAGKRRRQLKIERRETRPRPSRWPPRGSRPVQWWRRMED